MYDLLKNSFGTDVYVGPIQLQTYFFFPKSISSLNPVELIGLVWGKHCRKPICCIWWEFSWKIRPRSMLHALLVTKCSSVGRWLDTENHEGRRWCHFFLMTIVFVTNVYKTIMYNIYIYMYIHDLAHVYTHNMQIHSYIYIHSTVTPFWEPYNWHEHVFNSTVRLSDRMLWCKFRPEHSQVS